MNFTLNSVYLLIKTLSCLDKTISLQRLFSSHLIETSCGSKNSCNANCYCRKRQDYSSDHLSGRVLPSSQNGTIFRAQGKTRRISYVILNSISEIWSKQDVFRSTDTGPSLARLASQRIFARRLARVRLLDQSHPWLCLKLATAAMGGWELPNRECLHVEDRSTHPSKHTECELALFTYLALLLCSFLCIFRKACDRLIRLRKKSAPYCRA